MFLLTNGYNPLRYIRSARTVHNIRGKFFFRFRYMHAGSLVAADDMPDKAVTLAKISHDGIFVVRMRFVISSGKIDTGYFQTVSFQSRHICIQSLCRLVAVLPEIYS